MRNWKERYFVLEGEGGSADRRFSLAYFKKVPAAAAAAAAGLDPSAAAAEAEACGTIPVRPSLSPSLDVLL